MQQDSSNLLQSVIENNLPPHIASMFPKIGSVNLELLKALNPLKQFLSTPANMFDWSGGKWANQFFLPTSFTSNAAPSNIMNPEIHSEAISCVRWTDNRFYVTGTDIVRIVQFRLEAMGRRVVNAKKFEEGIFSDLRLLRKGTHAILENHRSPFLELLNKLGTIRTQKKQKIYFWDAVPHDDLLADTVERDLKRIEQGLEPTTVNVDEVINKQINMAFAGTQEFDVPQSEPAPEQFGMFFSEMNTDDEHIDLNKNSMPLSNPTEALSEEAVQDPAVSSMSNIFNTENHMVNTNSHNLFENSDLLDVDSLFAIPTPSESLNHSPKLKMSHEMPSSMTSGGGLNLVSPASVLSLDFTESLKDFVASEAQRLPGDINHSQHLLDNRPGTPASLHMVPISEPSTDVDNLTFLKLRSKLQTGSSRLPHIGHRRRISDSAIAGKNLVAINKMSPSHMRKWSNSDTAKLRMMSNSSEQQVWPVKHSRALSYPVDLPLSFNRTSDMMGMSMQKTLRAPSINSLIDSASNLASALSLQHISFSPSVQNHPLLSTMQSMSMQPNASVEGVLPNKTMTADGMRYFCQVSGCNKVFKRYEHMRRHARGHTGERPYECKVPNCNASFSRSDTLANHLRHYHTSDDLAAAAAIVSAASADLPHSGVPSTKKVVDTKESKMELLRDVSLKPQPNANAEPVNTSKPVSELKLATNFEVSCN